MNINMPQSITQTANPFSNGRVIFSGQAAEPRTDNSTFEIARRRTGTSRNDAMAQHREREARIQEMETARINSIRSQMANALRLNSELIERRNNMRTTSNQMSNRIDDLMSLLAEPYETDEALEARINRVVNRGHLDPNFSPTDYIEFMSNLVEYIRDLSLELKVFDKELEGLEYQVEQSAIATEYIIKMLEARIDAIISAGEERRQLNMSIKLKIQQLEQKEEMHERKLRAEESHAARNGEQVDRKNNPSKLLAIMNSQIESLHLLTYSRDMLTKESLGMDLEHNLSDMNEHHNLERVLKRIESVNEDIREKLNMEEEDFWVLINAQILDEMGQKVRNQRDNDEFTPAINIQL